MSRDVTVLRDLARRYMEIAQQPRMDALRDLWRRHNSLEKTRPLILVRFGPWNHWCGQMIEPGLRCEDGFCRGYEYALRLALLHADVGDDWVFEPWITQSAKRVTPAGSIWGPETRWKESSVPGGARQLDPPLKRFEDLSLMVEPHHVIDEEATARNVRRLEDAVGDILPVCVSRCPAYTGFSGDISSCIARLRGLEQIMYDMIESPEWLHRLLAFMRDGILTVHEEAEKAGDWSLCCHSNQAVPYAKELPAPSNSPQPAPRGKLWGFFAAQEYALVSPAMHDEFLLQYQLPIMKPFGLIAYGCCEDLTRKIKMLRAVPNLRRIAVTPSADVRKCAEQIGQDYVISWRPNPGEMVSFTFDEAHIRDVITEAMEATRGCHVDITLKDIENVEDEPQRLRRWVEIAGDVVEKY